MRPNERENNRPHSWDGTPQEDFFADWNAPSVEEYPAAGRHLSPKAREEYYAERDAYYARRDAYYAERDAYYAQRERERWEPTDGEPEDEYEDADMEDDFDDPEADGEESISYAPEDAATAPIASRPEKPKRGRKRRRGRGFRRFITFVLLAAIVLLLIGKAPVRNPDRLERIPGRSTILLCGTDEDGVRTDTILLLTLDRSESRIRLLSIPRDTYAPGYTVPKINSAYGAVGGGEKGMEQLMEQVKNVIGFMPDAYALIDLNAFVEAADLLGGLDFNVPIDMDYEDPDQDLFIHLRAGEQHLTGEQIMWVVRFRSGYANADIGRTEVQRAVLEAAMEQWLRPETITALPDLWRIYKENLTTDLSAQNLLWMLRVLIKGAGNDIESNVLPGYAAMAGDASVYMIDSYAAAPLLANYSPYK